MGDDARDPMADMSSFSADGATFTWVTAAGLPTDTLELTWENEAWTATATSIEHRSTAVIRVSPMWQVRQFLLFRDLDEPDLWLGTDGKTRWGEMNGAHRPELDGATAVVVPNAPLTHLVPIRHLALQPSTSAEVRALRCDIETLGVVPETVTYERHGDTAWTVARLDHAPIHLHFNHVGRHEWVVTSNDVSTR
jgi:hypothetical protein